MKPVFTAIIVASVFCSTPGRAETPAEVFARVMAPLAGRWICTGVDDATGRAIRLTEVNAFELNRSWFRSHEVDDSGVANDVITSFRSGEGKWRSILVNDDGTFGVFTYDNAPVPSSWATASLSTGKTARFWLKHAFVHPGVFLYDIRVMDRRRLARVEHGACKRV